MGGREGYQIGWVSLAPKEGICYSTLFVFRPLKTTIKLTYVISQVINLVKLTNLG